MTGLNNRSRWTRRSGRTAGLAAACLLVHGAAGATQYKLIVLNPNGGQANGIDNGRAVGFDTQGAAIWNSLGASVTRLPIPPGFQGVAPVAVSGSQEVGEGVIAATHQQRALLWNNNGANMTDLSTAGAGTSYATATDGAQQVGVAENGAALWAGTAASYVNLNPAGYGFSYAAGVSDGIQVGYGPNAGIGSNALLWHGTASSFVVLRQGAEALGISHGQVVGFAGAAGTDHGAMWTSGTPQSFVDLAPAGTTASELSATNGFQQVGDVSFEAGGATLPLDHRAGVWNGTASSFQMLPIPAGDNYSVATGIDAQGNISGRAGIDINGGLGSLVPIIWQPIPEPRFVTAAVCVSLLVCGRRRKQIHSI